MRNLTKAERIYIQTKSDARRYIESWGYEKGQSFTRMSYGDDEMLYTRTINALQKEINKDVSLAIDCFNFKFMTEEEYIMERRVIQMVQDTLDDEKKRK